MAFDATQLAGAVLAIGGLGAAAAGVVDGTKAFGGGLSNIGWPRIQAALKPYLPALAAQAAGSDWTTTIRANWINGLPKDEQKAAAKSLVRLGLTPDNAAGMALAGRVDPVRLRTVMTMVEAGDALDPADVNVLARFDASIDAALDAGFERADQQYRNSAKLCSGVVAVGLAVVSALAYPGLFQTPDMAERLGKALLIGLVAVPTAPIAKDLASALTTAAGTLKAARV